MTSTAGTTQHPDVSEISDLAEGLLSPSRTEEVRRHLDACVLCAGVQASLDEIRGLLGTLPGPLHMPVDVAGRIDATLAAEALLDCTAPEESAHVSRETPPAPRVAETSVTDRPVGRPRATTGPGRDRRAKRRRRNAVIGAVFGTATLGMGVLLLQPFQSSNDKDASADSGVSATKRSEDKFSKTPLEDRVRDLITKQPMSQRETAENGPSMDIESNSPKRAIETIVPQCVQDGTGRNTVPLAAEKGTYNGKSAFLVVLPHATDTTRVQAYVVDASCVEADPPAKGEILLTHAYSRR
ncbi:anti-sigma factor [Streptomyces sp. Wb2n-11]|uniref:anti-sigma factor family protein n=1 Tax=Streptomyces sp. Wb2n-11 TaxID=1030533 RepID=UPI000B0D3135|nr:zf-HC2 domain-containing protein [Streptomyces sp. Wb2n-11]